MLLFSSVITCAPLMQAFLWDVLLPTGNIMLGWSILMMLLLVYLATVLPYAVAFDIDFVSRAASAAVPAPTAATMFCCVCCCLHATHILTAIDIVPS